MAIINFGSIGRRRCVTFKVTEDGKVIPAKHRNGGLKIGYDEEEWLAELNSTGELITAHESFRRWKAARKAWNTRRGNKQQLTLPL